MMMMMVMMMMMLMMTMIWKCLLVPGVAGPPSPTTTQSVARLDVVVGLVPRQVWQGALGASGGNEGLH